MAALAVAPSRVTTWVLVRICPSASRITPEPEPDAFDEVAAMVTVEGVALAAAAVTALTESVLLTMVVPELAALSQPSVTKSCLSHRLKRLIAIAREGTSEE